MDNQQRRLNYYCYCSCDCESLLYIGSRQSVEEPLQDAYLGSFTHASFKPKHKLILYVTNTNRLIADFVEWAYMHAWSVGKNSKFANKQISPGSGFRAYTSAERSELAKRNADKALATKRLKYNGDICSEAGKLSQSAKLSELAKARKGTQIRDLAFKQNQSQAVKARWANFTEQERAAMIESSRLARIGMPSPKKGKPAKHKQIALMCLTRYGEDSAISYIIKQRSTTRANARTILAYWKKGGTEITSVQDMVCSDGKLSAVARQLGLV